MYKKLTYIEERMIDNRALSAKKEIPFTLINVCDIIIKIVAMRYK